VAIGEADTTNYNEYVMNHVCMYMYVGVQCTPARNDWTLGTVVVLDRHHVEDY